ncbi:MAG: septal ring lytic transglycosylase RlpA family protein [Xanthobacteraceae bacterium]
MNRKLNFPPWRALTVRNISTVVAALFMLAAGASAASAHGRHHHHHYHAGHHAWQDSNAAMGSSSGHSFTGMASFYGNEAGRQTASGHRFNQEEMTAAHRSLPFGTRLRVTHAGRSVIVTINDRGPFVRGRVLDLSTGAARAVGLTSRGVGLVVAEVL